jgi:hypothetical protein
MKLSRQTHATASRFSQLRDNVPAKSRQAIYRFIKAYRDLRPCLPSGRVGVKLSSLSIGLRLQSILLIVVLGMLAIGGANLWQLRHSLTEDRMTKTQHVVEVAHGMIRHYVAKESSGAMSRADAQAAALPS